MNQTVVITGAGRGLGFSLVKRHVELGDRVYAYERNIPDELTALAGGYEKLHVCQCDVSSTASVVSATSGLLEKEEQVHILYNNAGIAEDVGSGLADTDIDAGLAMIQVNALGLLRMCKAVLPLLGAGSVAVSVTSEAGSIGDCYRSNGYLYGMSKAAANMASMTLQNEVRERGVRVFCVHPGWLRSPMGGERAAASPYSVSCDKSAADIVEIATHIERLPDNVYFIEHTGKVKPW